VFATPLGGPHSPEGWPIVIVSRRLGHANPAITLSIYAHALTDTHGDDLQTPAAFADNT
jgi:integrase